MRLTVNGTAHDLDVDEQVPLLNVLRNDLALFGAKRGCAQEQCYSCSVLIDGRTQPSCQLQVGHVGDLPITTVEALDELQDFFIAEQAGQCGFCIAGMMVATAGLLNQVRYPNDQQIREALDTNICRCGVYDRFRRAIRFRIGDPQDPIWELRTQAPLDPSKPELATSTSTSLTENPGLDSWVQIDDADTITIHTGKVELGQGIRTVITHVASTQLGVDPSRIVLTKPDTHASPDEGRTAGSMSVLMSGEAVAAASATARSVLMSLAAERLSTSCDDLIVHDGTVTNPATGETATYWELHGGRSFDTLVDPALPRLRNFDESGETTTRVDLPNKVAGKPSFIHDVRESAMAHGRVLRPPHPEARLRELDTSQAGEMDGVVNVVVDGSFVGVVAEREEHADAAIEALRDAAVWDGESNLPTEPGDLFDMALKTIDVVEGSPVDHEVPSSASAPDGSFDLSATYSKNFTMHGSLGPSAAIAEWNGEQLRVRSSTQGVFLLQGALSDVLNLAPEAIRVEHVEGAGCYGHNGNDDVALDAALLAMAVPDRPIHTVWTRADEHRWEPYGPAMIMKLSGDVSGSSITALDFENWSYIHNTRPVQSGDGTSNLIASWHLEKPFERPLPPLRRGSHIGHYRNADPLYAIPRRRVRTHLAETNRIRTSALRGLGAFANTFAIETFVDEMAHHAGVDPVDFRLNNLDDERARAVIAAVAEKAWHTPRDEGVGRGIGFGQYKNVLAYFSVIVDLTVDRSTGEISILQATAATDCGTIVSPDGVSNQLEGGCVQAASWTLKEAVQLKPDGIVSEDWETYPVLRFSDSFPIETILLDRPDQPPLGVGETAQGPMAAAIGNAVFSATGHRLRDLPLSPDNVLRVLASTSTA